MSEDRRLFSDRLIPEAALGACERAADVPDCVGVDAKHLQQRKAVGVLACSDHPVDGAGQVPLGDVVGDAVQDRPVRREFRCQAE